MIIVWGSNHYRLKKVTPTEIGLLDPSFNGITFELRQRYGHLMWIPIFPLGKIWTVNKGDGNKYVCPPDIEHRLNAYGLRKSKLSIFAWSWFLLIGIGWILFSINDSISRRRWEKYEEERKVEAAVGLKDAINGISEGKFLVFQNENHSRIPMKVLAVQGDSLRLGGWAGPGQTEPMQISLNRDMAQYNEKPVTFSFWTSKSLLIKAVDLQAASNGKGFTGIQLYNFQQTFWLYKVTGMAPPELAIDQNSEGKTDYYCEVLNKGVRVKADSIVAVSEPETAKWQLSKNRDLFQDNKVAIKTNVVGKATLYCSDASGRVYAYTISNDGSWHINDPYSSEQYDYNDVYMER